VEQLLEGKGLGDEAFGAEPCDLDGLAERAKARDDQGDDVGIAGERLVQHLAAVDARQSQVGDEDIEGEVAEPCQRLFAAAGLLDAVTLLGEAFRHDLAKRRLVIDEEEMSGRLGHVATAF
jgi:hypothetical protein